MIEQENHVPCKICKSNANLFGVYDFNKSCEGQKVENIFPKTGIEISYYQCTNCRYIFSTNFDSWNHDDFKNKIYNDQYILVDPDFENTRPNANRNWVSSLIKKHESILDFGSGNGRFATLMQEIGYNARSFDPFFNKEVDIDLYFKFDVITCFEVLEHSPTPYQTIFEITKFLRPKTGKIIISTVIDDEYQHWRWYLSPRNGHVCMFSKKSLDILFEHFGMIIEHPFPNAQIVYWKE